MNGINYNALTGNSGLYSNQSGSIMDEAVKNAAAANSRTAEAKTDNRQANADKDTYEHGTQTVRAGYSRPDYSATKTNSNKYKALDANGIQEGITLSDKAKKVLEELRKKFGNNMDISVAEWSTDEEQDYYASLSSKEYSVLINPELLEKMADDDELKAKYMDIIGGADDKYEELKSQLGEDADLVKGFSITIDADGEVSYAVKLMKDMVESNKAKQEKAYEERVEERREERRKAEKERYERFEADSIEELVKALKERLHPEDAEEAEEDAQETAEKVVVSESDLNE